MLPLLGAMVTGGAGLLGSIFSSNQSGENTQAQIQASQQQQATQNAFSERMSSTAYQRAAQDMEAAGLNKSAMFGSGAAASSPSGSGIQAPMPQTKSSLEGLGDHTAKAVSAAVQMKTMDKMSDEMANLQVENKRLDEQVKLAHTQTATEAERTKEVGARTKNIEQDTLKGKLDRARQEFEAIKYLDLSEIPDAARKAGNIGSWAGGKVSDTISPLLSSARGVSGLLPRRTSRQSSGVDSKGNSYDRFEDTFSRFSSWR